MPPPRWRSATPLSRTADSAMTAATATASATTRITTPAAAAHPFDFWTNSSPGPSSGQSSTRSNGRSSTASKPMSRIFRMSRTPRTAPAAAATRRRARAGTARTTARPAIPSIGIRVNAPGVRPLNSAGATSAASTARKAATVTARPATRRRRVPVFRARSRAVSEPVRAPVSPPAASSGARSSRDMSCSVASSFVRSTRLSVVSTSFPGPVPAADAAPRDTLSGRTAVQTLSPFPGLRHHPGTRAARAEPEVMADEGGRKARPENSSAAELKRVSRGMSRTSVPPRPTGGAAPGGRPDGRTRHEQGDLRSDDLRRRIRRRT